MSELHNVHHAIVTLRKAAWFCTTAENAGAMALSDTTSGSNIMQLSSFCAGGALISYGLASLHLTDFPLVSEKLNTAVRNLQLWIADRMNTQRQELLRRNAVRSSVGAMPATIEKLFPISCACSKRQLL